MCSKSQLIANVSKESLFRNYKTCTHVYINNLTRMKILLEKYLLWKMKNHTAMTTYEIFIFHITKMYYKFQYIPNCSNYMYYCDTFLKARAAKNVR